MTEQVGQCSYAGSPFFKYCNVHKTTQAIKNNYSGIAHTSSSQPQLYGIFGMKNFAREGII